ncbi:MAG: acyl-CoA dehydrogenase family protein [Pseudomonadales bacterium]
MTAWLNDGVIDAIAEQATAADQSRTIAPAAIDGLRASPVMAMTAARDLGGRDACVVETAAVLREVVAACSSTAWCLWNHLCTFHLFCGLLGPEHARQLTQVVKASEWVCFPAGASTGVQAEQHGDTLVLNGKAAFGSGSRYAQWAGVTFVGEDRRQPHFALVDLRSPGVRIDPTWQAMSLRASSTDDVHYEGVEVSVSQVVPFPMMYRLHFRKPEVPMIAPRYREDWVGVSDLWLGAMAASLCQAALDDICSGIRERVAIMGVKVAERPLVQVNLGHAQGLITAAADTVQAALTATDQRIACATTPTEQVYLQQMSASMQALQLCDEAMRLMLRVQGGNGLREGASFERRYRDFQAMPLHINAHRDRVSEQVGRALLGLETTNPF